MIEFKQTTPLSWNGNAEDALLVMVISENIAYREKARRIWKEELGMFSRGARDLPGSEYLTKG